VVKQIKCLSVSIALMLLSAWTSNASVAINSPSNGATVSGTVTVKANITSAYWSKLWVDGNGIDTAAIGNVTFTWNSTSVGDGTHTLTVKAYPSGQPANAALSITVTVNNHSSTGGGAGYFGTLSSNASLPSGSWCAANVAWEPEVVTSNDGTNSTMPTSSWLSSWAANGYAANVGGGKWAYQRVDGHYTGTTDMIIRWAACKWGIDEDVVRAQSSAEHWNWHQPDSGGDKRTSYSQCVNGGFTSLWDFMCTDCCYQTWSIWQTKVYNNWMTWPMMRDSTAFAADFRYADQRACMDGDLAGYFAGKPAYNGHTYASDIASGNLNTILWGCIGVHYSGEWYDGNSSGGALWYIAAVKDMLAQKPWHRWTNVNWPD
jgi:hypothetical protein